MLPNCSSRPVPFYCFYRLFYCYCYCCSDQLFYCCSSTVPFRCSDYSTAAVSTDCYRPTATDRLLPTVPLLLSKVLLTDVLLPTNCYRVLLQSVLPTTVPFYPTALTLCFFYYYYYRYYYCCYCYYCYYYCYYCYCYRYYF